MDILVTNLDLKLHAGSLQIDKNVPASLEKIIIKGNLEKVAYVWKHKLLAILSVHLIFYTLIQ